MTINRRLGVGLGIVLLAGCGSVAPSTSSTVSASATPVALATPTGLATPIATSSPAAGWRKVQEFEPPRGAEIRSITVGGPGFVAVGTAHVDLQGPCSGEVRDGRVLTSPDGEQWTALEDDTFAHAKLDHVVESGDALYVLGRVNATEVGLEETPGACGEPPENLGFNIWRSADEGASWEQLAQAVEMQNADITDVISVEGVLVAVGNVVDPESGELLSSAVWTSMDGIEWRMTDTQPTPAFRRLASSGSVIVAAESEGSASLTYSDDGGGSWHQATVALDPAFTQLSVAARAGRFVAVGGPEISDDYAMSVFASDDGKAWAEVQSLQLGTSGINQLVALPDQFLGIGPESFRTQGGTQYTGDILTWVSVDGAEWLPGPAFSAGGILRTQLAAGPKGVVVATRSRDALWFAPLSTFE